MWLDDLASATQVVTFRVEAESIDDTAESLQFDVQIELIRRNRFVLLVSVYVKLRWDACLEYSDFDCEVAILKQPTTVRSFCYVLRVLSMCPMFSMFHMVVVFVVSMTVGRIRTCE
jgi:hypothetical protein